MADIPVKKQVRYHVLVEYRVITLKSVGGVVQGVCEKIDMSGEIDIALIGKIERSLKALKAVIQEINKTEEGEENTNDE